MRSPRRRWWRSWCKGRNSKLRGSEFRRSDSGSGRFALGLPARKLTLSLHSAGGAVFGRDYCSFQISRLYSPMVRPEEK